MSEQNILVIDGITIDGDTGEILSMPGDPVMAATKAHATAAEEKERMVERALYRLARVGAKKEALIAERDFLINAIKDTYEPRINALDRTERFITESHRPVMMELALKAVEGTKSKTASFMWGKIGFRASKGKLVVLDAIAAARALLEKGKFAALSIKLDGRTASPDLMNSLKSYLRQNGQAMDYESDTPLDITIRSTEVGDDLVEGLTREEPDTPLGNMYVKAGSTSKEDK